MYMFLYCHAIFGVVHLLEFRRSVEDAANASKF